MVPTSTSAGSPIHRPELEVAGRLSRMLVDQLRSIDVDYVVGDPSWTSTGTTLLRSGWHDDRMNSRWRGAAKRVRITAAVVVIALAYGTAVHVVHLIESGFDPYPDMPVWLRTYFVALTILDPLAAVLLARCTRAGVLAAVAVLVSNALANGWANYALDPSVGITLGRFGHAVIVLLALGICASARQLWRAATSPDETR